jgi:peptidoglycan/xylan/chitin deacetylase (PgdA/CDA1 family)
MLRFKTINIFFILLLIGVSVYDLRFEVSGWAYILIVLAYIAFQVYGSAVLSAQYFLPVKFEGSKASGAVALTFDDGPVPGKTDAILDILKSRGVSAAFFCIGNRVTANPLLMERIHQGGHLIGNHSYWHKATFDLQSAAKIAKELLDTDSAISETIGVRPNLFRPPYGVTNPMVAKAVKSSGYLTVGWSIRSFDTVIDDGDVLYERITKSLKGGDVILLHDHGSATIKILPALLDHIAKIGLKIVRVDELLNIKAYV